MSVRNFVQTLWAANADKALDEWLVGADFCNKEYEPTIINGPGDQVRVQQAIRPTITTTTDGKAITLGDAEAISDTSLTMTLLQQSYYDFKVDNVDEAQAKGTLKTMYTDEANQGVANEIDVHILSQAKDKAVKKSDSTALTKDTILNFINTGLQNLYQNNVPPNSPIELLISPVFHTVFLEAYQSRDTNNSEMLKKGIVAQYGNCVVKLTNNLYNDGTDDYCILRTNKAIAFAKPLTKMYAVDNASGFGDRIKGFTLYQSKVMRPEEIYVLRAHV